MSVLARSDPKQRDSRLWTADQFLDFYMTRPDGERWQLVDGLAMMMVPPSLRHQRIGRNLFRLLDRALEAGRPDLMVFYELGVRVPSEAGFNPEPDLLVIETEASFDRYADKFFFIAEVISPSNTAEMIDRKLELYRSHPDNLYCLTVDQDSVHVTLYARDLVWAPTEFRTLDATIRLPAFGFEAKLADIYDGTPLAR